MNIFSLTRNLVALTFLFACLFTRPATIEQILMGTDLPTTNTTAELAVASYQTLVQRFALTSPVTVSTIKLQMSGFGVDQFTLWVTNSIGPDTTKANVLFCTNLKFPETVGGISGATVSVPVNLKLAKGNYYIVLSSTQTDLHQGWLSSTTTLPSTIGSVGTWDVTLSPNEAFPPASIFRRDEPKPGAFQLLGKVD
jgi:hypothetical protein